MGIPAVLPAFSFGAARLWASSLLLQRLTVMGPGTRRWGHPALLQTVHCTAADGACRPCRALCYTRGGRLIDCVLCTVCNPLSVIVLSECGAPLTGPAAPLPGLAARRLTPAPCTPPANSAQSLCTLIHSSAARADRDVCTHGHMQPCTCTHSHSDVCLALASGEGGANVPSIWRHALCFSVVHKQLVGKPIWLGCGVDDVDVQ